MFLCVELSLGDDMFESSKNPLEEVTAGLLDSAGQQLPLQAVHVKCKLMDLLSQVMVAHRVFSVFFIVSLLTYDLTFDVIVCLLVRSSSSRNTQI